MPVRSLIARVLGKHLGAPADEHLTADRRLLQGVAGSTLASLDRCPTQAIRSVLKSSACVGGDAKMLRRWLGRNRGHLTYERALAAFDQTLPVMSRGGVIL